MLNKFKLDTTKSGQAKEAISRTLAIANNYAGELTIEVIPLEKIEIDPENKRELLLTLHDAMHGIDKNDPDFDRKKQDWKSLESLSKTILADQLINPIFVYRYGNKCRLIAGERRTLASAIAGKKEIIARIANQRPIGTKLRILQWVENHERSELTISERIASLESILHEYFLENKDEKKRVTSKLLSDLTGMSVTQARRYILILESNSEIRRAINDGKIENIKLIELICSMDNPEHQQLLLLEAIAGKTFEFISNLKKELETSSIQRSKKVESRGRKKTNVNLGSTKPNTVKIIFEALLASKIIGVHVIDEIAEMFRQTQWENTKLVEKSFKKIMLLLDNGVECNNE